MWVWVISYNPRYFNTLTFNLTLTVGIISNQLSTELLDGSKERGRFTSEVGRVKLEYMYGAVFWARKTVYEDSIVGRLGKRWLTTPP